MEFEGTPALSPASPNAGLAKLTPRSPRFEHTVHTIPTPGHHRQRPARYEPFVLNFWLIGGVGILMIALGIGLQVALHISNTQNGFAVPVKNVFTFVSTGFLTSFFPTLLVVPLAYFWSVADWMLRWYQPYVTLSEGNAPASRSILLDYIALNRIAVLYHSLLHRHVLIYMSTLIALLAVLLQPLAGSVLQLKDVPNTSAVTAIITSTVALSPNVDQLDAFYASSGFVQAATYYNWSDPSYVKYSWTSAEFQAPPGAWLNGTLSVNTTGILTEVNCTQSTNVQVNGNPSNSGAVSASATFSNGCSSNFTFSGTGTQLSGVVNPSNCAESQGLGVEFQPVVFWFYLQGSSPIPGVNVPIASVYCNPAMKVYMTQSTMNLDSGGMYEYQALNLLENTNNVTGSPLYGRPYNGLLFAQSNVTSVSSRAQAISFAIPQTIFSLAAGGVGGAGSAFQGTDGFVNITTSIYTRYLAVAAQGNYFGPTNITAPAQLTSQIPRLFVEALPSYILTVLLIIIGCAGLTVHYIHRRTRSNLWLTSPPGSIAAIVSLTSRSGFGDLLLPYDDQGRIEDNLAGLRFRLDSRTGAIVAEEESEIGGKDREGEGDGMVLRRKTVYDSPGLVVEGGLNSSSALTGTTFKEAGFTF